MTKPDLHLVEPTIDTAGFSERIRMMALREKLIASAVRYVKNGRVGIMQDRLREASDITGIPRLLLEVEVRNPLRATADQQ